MTATLKISIALISLVLLGALLWFMVRGGDGVEPPVNVEPTPSFPVPDTNPAIPISEDALTELLKGGNVIDVGSGAYILAGGNSYTEAPQYQIIYFAPDSSFTISLMKRPLSEARKAAEQELIKLLDISQAGACEKRVTVGVPYAVDPTFAGQSLGLSFCPGSVELP